MICVKCGHEIMEGAAFCPYCGEKVAQGGSGPETPIYQADVKRPLKPAGKLLVYRDRTEFVTSSVQKAVFKYTGLVSVKKGMLDSIDFITEDGRTETCPADRKCVHEALVHIEQASRSYLAQRKERLLAQGVRYSFPSNQGFLNDGVLNLSAEQAEFKAKSGKSVVVSYGDVKSVSASGGMLDFVLFGGGAKSFAIGKELRDEVLAFVTDSIAPYLARRKEELLAQGIYFSSQSPDGRTLNVLADRAECLGRSGRVETAVSFQNVRAAGVSAGTLELALTDGTSKLFPVEEDMAADVLAFVKKAIEPYVTARTAGFDMVFGKDERLEINEERGVFHIIRQGGREITGEWPLDALQQCAWTERTELSMLGSVVSGGIDLFQRAKAAGSQAAAETEERISSAGALLTIRTEQEAQSQSVWFGLFPTGMSRSNNKYDQYLTEWARLSEYLKTRCPACELTEPALPEPENSLPETAALPDSGGVEAAAPGAAGEGERAPSNLEAAARRDDLGIAKYIEGVSRFIGNCTTPMTIAFQGNRISGGSSTLGMLFDRLRERWGDGLLWLNVRQFSQGESGEALAVLVGKKLVGLLSGESTTDAKNRATNIAAGVIKLVAGAIAPDSSAADDLVDGILDQKSADSAAQMVRLFSKQVEARARGESGKVIFFVDGLDHLDPARAVELLEAMREYFGCKGCVFVVAADYQDILTGAREHYDENRAKRFFDGMFRANFQVPASSYNVQSYVKGKLEDIGIQAESGAELELYAALIQSSIGKDTETIDRLFVSFQLLRDMTGGEVYESRYKRLALFALLCMQTRFRDAYDYAVRRRDSVTPEFLGRLCGGSIQFQDAEQADDEERAAYRDFGSVFAQVINLDGETEISEAECQAFAEVLELSSVTSR